MQDAIQVLGFTLRASHNHQRCLDIISHIYRNYLAGLRQHLFQNNTLLVIYLNHISHCKRFKI